MRIAVTGARGQLGRDLARVLAASEHHGSMFDRDALDVRDAAACADALRDADAVIHAASWTDVDGAESDPDAARAVNVFGANNVAAASRYCVVISTDFVFDGTAGRPYVESDEPNPIQVYGRTKLMGERAAALACERTAIARTAWLYGAALADGRPARNFVRAILGALARGEPFDVVDDQVGSPTWTEDLARALVGLCESGDSGVFHLANAGEVARDAFARAIAEESGFDPSLVRSVATSDAPPRAARRPAYAPLTTTRAAPMPDWRDALARAMPDILAVP